MVRPFWFYTDEDIRGGKSVNQIYNTLTPDPDQCVYFGRTPMMSWYTGNCSESVSYICERPVNPGCPISADRTFTEPWTCSTSQLRHKGYWAYLDGQWKFPVPSDMKITGLFHFLITRLLNYYFFNQSTHPSPFYVRLMLKIYHSTWQTTIEYEL